MLILGTNDFPKLVRDHPRYVHLFTYGSITYSSIRDDTLLISMFLLSLIMRINIYGFPKENKKYQEMRKHVPYTLMHVLKIQEE